MFQNSVGPDPNEGKSDRTIAREAFFLEFAKILRKEFPDVPLMVTGGFSSRLGLERAVADGDCDLVGLGRPAATNPSLPNNIIFNAEIKDQDATLYRKQNKTPWILKQLGMASVGAGIDSVGCDVSSGHEKRLTFSAAMAHEPDPGICESLDAVVETERGDGNEGKEDRKPV